MWIQPALMSLLVALQAGEVVPCESETPREQFERVERQVEAWQPTAEERRFDEIGWAGGVRDAIRLAKSLDRPIFLFTHDGHMNVGRC